LKKCVAQELESLGNSLKCRFERTGNVLDLSEAISIQQQAIQLTPNGHPDMLGRLNDLGISFQHRFQHTGDVSDISEAISVQQRAVQLIPNGHAHMPGILSNLGNSFQCRFKRTGNVSDVSEAISLHQKAVQLTPDGHADIPSLLGNLGNSFQCRFTRTGDVSDISEAISVQQKAIKLTKNDHIDMAGQLCNLGVSFLCRFEQTGDVCDVSEAISVHQRAVQLTPSGHADKPGRLNNLGNSFRCRFERTGSISDLSEAISVQQQSVGLTPNGHPNMPGRLNSLGHSFRCRFQQTNDASDLSEAILVQQRGIQLSPIGHAEIPGWLNNLGTSFRCRFHCTGNISDVSEAISVHQRAVQLTPNGHPNLPGWLNNLGTSFRSRFERTGDVSDLSEAISVQQHAIQLSPNDHPDMPGQLSNLGTLFLCRFDRTGNFSDVSEAISVHQRAVRLTPYGHADRPGQLNNLGSSFRCRFEHTRDVSDISEAISFYQQAIQLTPNGHANMPGLLNNLGISFRCRFECTGNIPDVSEAITVQQQAVQLTPNGHAEMPGWLYNLGISFWCRFQRSGAVSDAHTATLTFRKSATTFGLPSTRLFAARKWAHFSKFLCLPQVLTAYGVLLDLIAQIAGLDRTIQQRHTDLIGISNLTTSAASVAFNLGAVDKVLEWLEQGRCLVWSQLNQLHTPLDHLRAHDEHLAQRFSDIAGALETSGSRHGSEGLSTDASMSQKMCLQDEAHLHVKLSREWSELLDEIRRIPKFHDFLRPPRASDLLKHLPLDGVVILINVHEDRCDALALVSGVGAPMHIPLDFTYDEASNLRERLRRFLSNHRVRMREEERGPRTVLEGDTDIQSEIHLILEALWLRVVRPIRDALICSVSVFSISCHIIVLILLSKSPAASDPARIWWCPTGPLAFLPLHAAGIYSPNGRSPPGSCISDFAISSYTPTVSSLLEKLKESVNVQQPASSKLLIISQPNTPGRSAIPATTKEMNCIWDTTDASHSNTLCLEGEFASISRVKLEMESYGSIHLACHATQDIENPLKSGFYLHDGRLELSEIMKQKFVVRELAFLSAFQTSAGTEKLSEEAVHLAAGMLAAGYRGVVATMWSIKDRYGPLVAESFYKDLMERGKALGKPGLDSSGAAHALHHSIQGIRKTLGDTEQGLLTWVPYVYFGY